MTSTTLTIDRAARDAFDLALIAVELHPSLLTALYGGLGIGRPGGCVPRLGAEHEPTDQVDHRDVTPVERGCVSHGASGQGVRIGGLATRYPWEQGCSKTVALQRAYVLGRSAPGSTSSLSPADAILCKCEATAPVRRLHILPESLDDAAWKSGIVTEDFRH
ncbi:MAG: hypothetical protein VX290_14505, partial [Candidatus Latescibacterota bacterium]|nr:hypothetical protein [Candidatus Latescibacterota bacterium]